MLSTVDLICSLVISISKFNPTISFLFLLSNIYTLLSSSNFNSISICFTVSGPIFISERIIFFVWFIEPSLNPFLPSYLKSPGKNATSENGENVDCIENRFVYFPSHMKHMGTNHTDQKRRVVINFNFLW